MEGSFIAGGTQVLEPGRSSRNIQIQKEVDDLKMIIGYLIIANETQKNFNPRGEMGSLEFADKLGIPEDKSIHAFTNNQIYAVLR